MCPHATAYYPYYFFTRYPQKITTLWNLKNLLTPGSWLMYFITIICIILYIKLSAYVGRILGLNTITEEITLVPFRCLEYFVFRRFHFIFQSITDRKSNYKSFIFQKWLFIKFHSVIVGYIWWIYDVCICFLFR